MTPGGDNSAGATPRDRVLARGHDQLGHEQQDPCSEPHAHDQSSFVYLSRCFLDSLSSSMQPTARCELMSQTRSFYHTVLLLATGPSVPKPFVPHVTSSSKSPPPDRTVLLV